MNARRFYLLLQEEISECEKQSADMVLKNADFLKNQAVEKSDLIFQQMENRCLPMSNIPDHMIKSYSNIPLPTFSGQGGLNIYQFEKNLKDLLDQRCVPQSAREYYVLRQLRGPAKKTIIDKSLSNPSAKQIFKLLKNCYGSGLKIMAHIAACHLRIGPIPSEETKPFPDLVAYQTCSGHLKLLQETEELEKMYQSGYLKENPLTEPYVAFLQTLLPYSDLRHLQRHDGYYKKNCPGEIYADSGNSAKY